jgi:SAM-dependent methyltransferase
MYNTYRFGNFNYGHKRIETEPLLIEFLGNAKDSDVVFDIGCGSGFWVETYCSAGISSDRLTLLDLAPRNAAMLRSKGLRAVCGDVLSLPFDGSVADLTICNGVIHHTPNPLQAFAELIRITKPGGHVYLNVYNMWNPYFQIVHRATLPIRWYYWNRNKKIIKYILPVVRIVYQPLARLAVGTMLDDETAHTMFMDQVITPRAYLFHKAKIDRMARENNCAVEKYRYNKCFTMLAAILRVRK